MKTSFVAAAVASLLTVGLAAPSFAETPPNMLVIANRIDDIKTFDPAESFEFAGADVSRNVYEKLVNFDPLDLDAGYQPQLADSWDISEDGMTITFTMADGHVFASGNTVTAKDAEFSLRRAVTLNKTPSFILTQFGFTPENVEQTIVAPDDKTLVLTLDKPYALSFVLNCLTATIGGIVDMETAMANEVDGDMGNAWLRTNTAGSGPYKVVDWKPSESVLMDLNPNYGGDAPAMERVIVQHIQESATQRLQLERGDIDVARNLSPEDVAGLADVDGVKVIDELRGRLMYFSANQKNEMLSDPKVLEALKLATDYEGMSGSFLKGQYTVHQAFLPLTFLGALEEKPFSYDMDAAKSALAASGHPDCGPIKISVRDAQERLDIAQSLQNTWGQLGCDIQLIVGTGAQTLDRYRAREHDIYLGAWGPDYPDPNTNAGTFAFNPDNSDEAGATGLLAWRNAWGIPEMSEKTLAAVVENDTATRAEMYRELQREHQQVSPFGVMFQQIEQNGMRSNVENFVAGGATTAVSYWVITK
ncbi:MULTISPECIES: ABC transporter substrate-binding protein [Marivita]|uniref:ABC transporter substrate-binding protein n=1 Tax=Marivita cryptomonadis TaxID=505252 RepID=A0A9Q2P890_9RHOB|nr:MULTISPECIES: ABC transporter substrate-binding protein [Marivita]MCR9169869.1 ABC transporter substrate-binding protein [Paracoccaceae bacterium]MBM2324053.1 ABC transporter substrate-binding protein [Marivita cryptomonadis]MBM2333643.1 ABC transporter substrate-binding protein [Marivita cryptomonadis]MBM2343220.1 ABC transporter substrate-binding protein [Marivita cryptomonadis]MBM2347892.1 ABC transporter substrate-binding protein [Marivita cryptomonadis]